MVKVVKVKMVKINFGNAVVFSINKYIIINLFIGVNLTVCFSILTKMTMTK